MSFKDFSFITDLEKNYDKHPVVCFFCGKPITFKKFYKQYENEKKFCSKKCINNYVSETNEKVISGEKFSSQTEKTIYSYLTLIYPNNLIRHNIIDVFPPYELDLSITFNDIPIYIEYNGVLHASKSIKGSRKRTIEKCQLNDKIKKDELCINRKCKLIRLWSEIGLYSKPDIFNNSLIELKSKIDLVSSKYINCNNGICFEILIDKNGDIHNFFDKY